MAENVPMLERSVLVCGLLFALGCGVRQFAAMDLDRQVRDRQRSEDSVAIEADVSRSCRDDGDDAATPTWAQFPHM
jgi:hypothetical protein